MLRFYCCLPISKLVCIQKAFFFLFWAKRLRSYAVSRSYRLNLTSSTYTVLSAGFSIFVHWKVAVNRVHNLHPCTGFLFLVYSRIYYGLYTELYFTYKWTRHLRWIFFCTVKTADMVAYSKFWVFWLSLNVWCGLVIRALVTHAADLSSNSTHYIFKNFCFTGFFR